MPMSTLSPARLWDLVTAIEAVLLATVPEPHVARSIIGCDPSRHHDAQLKADSDYDCGMSDPESESQSESKPTFDRRAACPGLRAIDPHSATPAVPEAACKLPVLGPSSATVAGLALVCVSDVVQFPLVARLVVRITASILAAIDTHASECKVEGGLDAVLPGVHCLNSLAASDDEFVFKKLRAFATLPDTLWRLSLSAKVNQTTDAAEPKSVAGASGHARNAPSEAQTRCAASLAGVSQVPDSEATLATPGPGATSRLSDPVLFSLGTSEPAPPSQQAALATSLNAASNSDRQPVWTAACAPMISSLLLCAWNLARGTAVPTPTDVGLARGLHIALDALDWANSESSDSESSLSPGLAAGVRRVALGFLRNFFWGGSPRAPLHDLAEMDGCARTRGSIMMRSPASTERDFEAESTSMDESSRCPPELGLLLRAFSSTEASRKAHYRQAVLRLPGAPLSGYGFISPNAICVSWECEKHIISTLWELLRRWDREGRTFGIQRLSVGGWRVSASASDQPGRRTVLVNALQRAVRALRQVTGMDSGSGSTGTSPVAACEHGWPTRRNPAVLQRPLSAACSTEVLTILECLGQVTSKLLLEPTLTRARASLPVRFGNLDLDGNDVGIEGYGAAHLRTPEQAEVNSESDHPWALPAHLIQASMVLGNVLQCCSADSQLELKIVSSGARCLMDILDTLRLHALIQAYDDSASDPDANLNGTASGSHGGNGTGGLGRSWLHECLDCLKHLSDASVSCLISHGNLMPGQTASDLMSIVKILAPYGSDPACLVAMLVRFGNTMGAASGSPAVKSDLQATLSALRLREVSCLQVHIAASFVPVNASFKFI